MATSNNITVIDFTLSGIRLIYGYFFHGKVYVLQSLESSTLPLDENGYLSSKETTEVLNMLLTTLKEQTESDVNTVIPLYPANGFVVKQSSSTVATIDQTSHILQMDFINCCSMINKENKDKTTKIIYNEPIRFYDDYRREYVDFPLGIQSDHLSVSCYSHLINIDVYEHYRSILNSLNLNIYFELVSPVAASMFINYFDAPNDYISLDLEKEYIYLSHISNHHILDSKYIKYGLNHITQTFANKMGIQLDRAEELINLFGLNDDTPFKFQTEDKFTVSDINSNLSGSFKTLIDYLNNYITTNNISADTPLILYGLGGDIVSITTLLSQSLNRQVKLFSPTVIGARSKSFVSCLGAIRASEFKYQASLNETKKFENNINYTRGRFYRED